MRTLLFTLLCFWQCTAQATNYFVKDKSCEAISPEIEISLSATLRDLDNHQRKRQNHLEPSRKAERYAIF